MKANDPNTLSKFGDRITLTDNWATSFLKSINQFKRIGAIGNFEPPLQLLAEKGFTFQKSIATILYDYDIQSDIITNLDQTPLSYVSSWK